MNQRLQSTAKGVRPDRPGWLRLVLWPFRGLGGRVASPGARALGSVWQRVPTINLLAIRPKSNRSLLLLRTGLASLVVVAGALLLALPQARAASQQDLTIAKESLATAQSQLATEKKELQGFRDQVGELRQQLEAAQQVYQQVTAESVDWGAGLKALFQVKVSGVRFASVVAEPEGQVELTGVATDTQSIAKLQTLLQHSGNPFELRSIQWEEVGNSISFTASVKLGK